MTPIPTAVPPHLASSTPAWGGFWDLLLEGPDAGEWAINAARIAGGQLRQVDHHRLPTWLLMTGGLHRAGIDLVTAGHLVNRGLYIVMGLCTWLAGRLLLGPGTALLAATLALGSPHLRLASERYGIDIGVGAAVALIAATALAAGRWPKAAPVLGIALCAAVLTHYTTLPLWLPALLLAAAAAVPGQRWRAAGGLSISLLVCGLLAHHFLRLPTAHELIGVVLDGLPGANSGAA
ncbi:MAG: hypothetical protein GXP62_00070, partial [Oligoflexia bacterium]|nr:hypothetical protein [Oligoflexia bacterium]